MPPSKSIPVHMKHTKNDNRFRDANGETGHDIIQRHKQDYGVDLNELNVFEDPIPYFRWFLNRIKETDNLCDKRLYMSFLVQYSSNNWCMDKLKRIDDAYDIIAEAALWFQEKDVKTGAAGMCAFVWRKPVPGTPFAEYGYMNDPTIKWEVPKDVGLYPPTEPLPDKFPLYEMTGSKTPIWTRGTPPNGGKNFRGHVPARERETKPGYYARKDPDDEDDGKK